MLGDERGMTMMEVLIAMVVLLVGLLGVFGVFSTSTDSVAAAETSAAMAQAGQAVLQQVSALPYTSVANSSTPTQTTPLTTSNPTYYLSTCGSNTCYQPSPSSSATEIVDVDTTNGKVAPGPTNVVVAAPYSTGCTPSSTSACRLVLKVYTFVTEVTDSICSQTGVTCSTTPSYKRVTVAVTNATSRGPINPVYLSTYVFNDAGGSANPLTSTSTTCVDGTTDVSCVH